MNKILNEDAWKFIKSLPDNSVDSIITDPMYDEEVPIGELQRICKGNIICFCSPENQFFTPDEYAFWIKTPSTKNFSKHLGRFVEMILISRGEYFDPSFHWSNYTGVYTDMLLTKQIHPYEKPASLMERLVSIFTRPGDTVFDPFFGSGSTLKAAIKLGRNPMGCEINKVYFDTFKDWYWNA